VGRHRPVTATAGATYPGPGVIRANRGNSLSAGLARHLPVHSVCLRNHLRSNLLAFEKRISTTAPVTLVFRMGRITSIPTE
jgi:hypothetical protein